MQEQKTEVYHSWSHGFEVMVGFDAPLFNAWVWQHWDKVSDIIQCIFFSLRLFYSEKRLQGEEGVIVPLPHPSYFCLHPLPHKCYVEFDHLSGQITTFVCIITTNFSVIMGKFLKSNFITFHVSAFTFLSWFNFPDVSTVLIMKIQSRLNRKCSPCFKFY